MERIDDAVEMEAFTAFWDNTLASTASDVYVEAVERATTLNTTETAWFDPTTQLKLKPDRWLYWNEPVPSATHQIEWSWTSIPPKTDHPNHPSAMQCKEQLGALDAAAHMGIVEYLPPGAEPSTFVDNILPLGAVVKPNGKIRMLVDPTLPGVNQCMAHLPCRLTTIEDIFKFVNPSAWLGRRDLDNGFYHCSLSPSARRYMGFRNPANSRIGRWVALPQGTKQSPALFCSVTDAAARILTRICAEHGVNCHWFVYVDDFIPVGATRADVARAFQLSDHEAPLLGLSWNPSKDIGPTQQLEALGLLIDAPNLTLSLPQTKREAYLQQIEAFITSYSNQPTCPRKAMEQLVGKLAFTCRVCRWGYLFIQALLDALYPGFERRSRHVTLTDAVWADISFWQSALGPDFHRWMGVSQAMIDTKEVRIEQRNFQLHVFSDASKAFGVGGVMDGEIYSARWNRNVTEEHIGALELEALYWNLERFKTKLTGTRVLAWLDNVQAVAAINKGASRIPALRSTLLKVAWLGLEHNFEVRAKHIKGIYNPADAPSRGTHTKPTNQTFTFVEFDRFNSPPAQVDCCASVSGHTAHPGCTEWYSSARPVQQHTQDLQGKVLWACIPFKLTHTILASIVDAWNSNPLATLATVVVPDWPTATWYCKYIRRKQPIFKLLHRYPAGSQVFKFSDTQDLAPPCPYPIMVLRIGSPPV